MGDKYKINGDRKMPRVGQEDQLSGYRVWPRANGFTGRAQNSPPAFTPQGQRASDKALTLYVQCQVISQRDTSPRTPKSRFSDIQHAENILDGCCDQEYRATSFWPAPKIGTA